LKPPPIITRHILTPPTHPPTPPTHAQVKYILGLKLPRADTLIEQLRLIFSNLNQFSWREFLMGMSFLLLLVVMKHLGSRYR
jgi:sulfate transporter 4